MREINLVYITERRLRRRRFSTGPWAFGRAAAGGRCAAAVNTVYIERARESKNPPGGSFLERLPSILTSILTSTATSILDGRCGGRYGGR